MPDPVAPNARQTCMRRFAAPLTALALLWACGDESPGPIVPQSLAIVSGHGQTGPAGDVVTEDFTVRVVGSDGQPFAGTTVTWAVATGGGSIAPVTATTDASGLASARLTLGVALGDNTATATVSGVPPATFRATAIDPCDYLRPIGVGDATIGTLRAPDCRLGDNTFIDFYALDFDRQQRADIALSATGFDPFLFFFDEVQVIAGDDSSGGADNALLPVLLPAGLYAIGANSSEPGSGSYDLSVTAGAEDVTNCDFVWIRPGFTTNQQITSGDCDLGTNWYGDAYPMLLRAGVTLTVTQQSAAFDALIEIYEGTTFNLVASDDNGGGGTNARVDYLVPGNAVFVVLTTSASAGQSGAYSMTVVSSGPLATTARAGRPATALLESAPRRRPTVRLAAPEWRAAMRRSGGD